MKTELDFIEEHFPNYHSSEDIARWNDLQKLVDGEFEEGDDAHTLLNKEFGGDYGRAYPLIVLAHTEATKQIYEKSIQGFKTKELKEGVSRERKVQILEIDDATQVEYKAYPVQAEPENNVKEGWDIYIYRVTIYSSGLDVEVDLTNYDEERIKDLIIKNLEK